MANKKKKKKVTKATQLISEGVDFKKLYATILTEAEKKIELDKLLKEANTIEPATGMMQIMHPPMQQYPKQAGKTYIQAKLINDLYGKAGQVGSYTGNNAAQHQWLTWMKQQMQKLHPGVTKVVVEKNPHFFSVDFIVYSNVSGQQYAVRESISEELLVSALSLEDLGHTILDRLKNSIKKALPAHVGNPGNMAIVASPYMDDNKAFIVPKDMYKGFEEYAKTFKDLKFKSLAGSWLEKHQPPPKVVPVPPDEDKKYDLTPIQEYNLALQKIEHHAKTVNQKNIWGEIEASVKSHIKKQQAEAKIAASKAKGFRGHVVQDSLKEVLPCLYEQVKCPNISCRETEDMATMIIHLNDGHMWTREAIADWAESLDIDISVKETK